MKIPSNRLRSNGEKKRKLANKQPSSKSKDYILKSAITEPPSTTIVQHAVPRPENNQFLVDDRARAAATYKVLVDMMFKKTLTPALASEYYSLVESELGRNRELALVIDVENVNLLFRLMEHYIPCPEHLIVKLLMLGSDPGVRKNSVSKM